MEAQLYDLEVIQKVKENPPDQAVNYLKAYYHENGQTAAEGKEIPYNDVSPTALELMYHSIYSEINCNGMGGKNESIVGTKEPVVYIMQKRLSQLLAMANDRGKEECEMVWSAASNIQQQSCTKKTVVQWCQFLFDTKRHKDDAPDDYWGVRALSEERSTEIDRQFIPVYKRLKSNFFPALIKRYQKPEDEITALFQEAIYKFHKSYIRTGKICTRDEYVLGISESLAALLIIIGNNKATKMSKSEQFWNDLVRDIDSTMGVAAKVNLPDTSEELSNKACLNILKEAREELTPKQQQILKLKYYSSIRGAEIAEQMGYANARVVRGILFKAKAAYRAAILNRINAQNLQTDDLLETLCRAAGMDFLFNDEEE